MTLTPESIRGCLEGDVPSTVTTCDRDGIPNVTYITQAHFVDASHLALSFQFFSKTHQNVMANPHAEIAVIHGVTGARYHIEADYVRTETSGPLFETMKAKLAGIARHVGMAEVFRLQGADVYRVLGIARVSRNEPAEPPSRINMLTALRAVIGRIPRATDLSSLFEATLADLSTHFDIQHSMLMMFDRGGARLYVVASHGYSESGAGSEIPIGAGVIGIAAAHRAPIGISYAPLDYSYGRAIRDGVAQTGSMPALETAIAFPGLSEPASQIAVPIVMGGNLIGVLYAESPRPLMFKHPTEDALVAVADALGLAIRSMQDPPDGPGGAGGPDGEDQGGPVANRIPPAGASKPSEPGGDGSSRQDAVRVRYFAADSSVFVGDHYLIKGVAGSILAKLVRDYLSARRTEFSNRELRLDPSIPLPDLSDNLEARLVLLQKRLVERAACIQMERTGRGRFRLNVSRPVELVEVPAR